MINKNCEKCENYVLKSHYKLCGRCYKAEITKTRNLTNVEKHYIDKNEKELTELDSCKITIENLKNELLERDKIISEKDNLIEQLQRKYFILTTGSYYVKIDSLGDKRYFDENDLLHRTNGPAIEWSNGNKHYYNHGERIIKKE